MKAFQRLTAIVLAVAVLTSTFTGCSSTTLINSSPEGAKLYMNGEFKGTTPYRHEDTAISGATTMIQLKKEGYEDFNGVLSKNEQVNVGAIIGGVFFLFPFIWTMGYYPTHNYELQPDVTPFPAP